MLFVWFHIPYQESACRFENHARFTGRKSYSITNKRSYVSNKETTEHVKNNVINSKDLYITFILRNMLWIFPFVIIQLPTKREGKQSSFHSNCWVNKAEKSQKLTSLGSAGIFHEIKYNFKVEVWSKHYSLFEDPKTWLMWVMVIFLIKCKNVFTVKSKLIRA